MYCYVLAADLASPRTYGPRTQPSEVARYRCRDFLNTLWRTARLYFTSPAFKRELERTGLDIHEHPRLTPFTTEELQPGMVLSIEPRHTADERRYHVEDLMEVTETGARILPRSDDWDTLLQVA